MGVGPSLHGSLIGTVNFHASVGGRFAGDIGAPPTDGGAGDIFTYDEAVESVLPQSSEIGTRCRSHNVGHPATCYIVILGMLF